MENHLQIPNQYFSRPLVPANLTFYDAVLRKAYANYIVILMVMLELLGTPS